MQRHAARLKGWLKATGLLRRGGQPANVYRVGPTWRDEVCMVLWALLVAVAIGKVDDKARERQAAAAQQTAASQREAAELARRYAAVIAACLNGHHITDGDMIVQCRRVGSYPKAEQ